MWTELTAVIAAALVTGCNWLPHKQSGEHQQDISASHCWAVLTMLLLSRICMTLRDFLLDPILDPVFDPITLNPIGP